MTEWVGIDGWGNNDLIQAGISEGVVSGVGVEIQPWWEVLPSGMTNIPDMAVSPGDQITVTISEMNPEDWSIILKDDTTNVSFTTTQAYTGPATSAEWIVEAPTFFAPVPLAPYSPAIAFSGMGVGGSGSTLTAVTLIQHGVVAASPSPLTASGFTDAAS